MLRLCSTLVSLLLVVGVAYGQADNSSSTHRSCEDCHHCTHSHATATDTASLEKKFSYRECLTCHDGQLAEEPNPTLHFAHIHIDKKEGLKCSICHNPHDRSGSFCMLRSKYGQPLTAKTAGLDFCRECH